ncbi:uncharacterized protein LOC135838143 isoform X2 [Planococcus citri]
MKTRKELLEKQAHSLLAQRRQQQQQQSGIAMNCGKPRRDQQVAATATATTAEHALQRHLTAFSTLESATAAFVVTSNSNSNSNSGGKDDDDEDGIEKAMVTLKKWRNRLQAENELLRCTIVNLQAEVCGARLAAKYLDKELAGRIQQLQLLSREDMQNEVKTKLWDQLDAEILLQRHKTVIKVMRQQRNDSLLPPPPAPDNLAGRVRNVYLIREPNKGLGISVTGGREHGVPIIVSELEPWCAHKGLYIGDAILSVNNIDLNKLTHSEAVKILSDQIGSVTLTVITLSEAAINLDEIQEEINLPSSYYSYPFHRYVDRPDRVSDRDRDRDADETTEMAGSDDAPTVATTTTTFQFQHQRSNIRRPAIRNSTNNCASGHVDSENKLLGITTLQNIFRTNSAINSTSNEYENEYDSKGGGGGGGGGTAAEHQQNTRRKHVNDGDGDGTLANDEKCESDRDDNTRHSHVDVDVDVEPDVSSRGRHGNAAVLVQVHDIKMTASTSASAGAGTRKSNAKVRVTETRPPQRVPITSGIGNSDVGTPV